MSRYPLAGLLAAAILVAPGAAGAMSFDDPAQPDPNEVVCRRSTPDVGTIMTRRICKTRAQWAADAAANQQRVVEREARSTLGNRDSN